MPYRLLFLLLLTLPARAQNLLPNPDFERYATCPSKLSESKLCTAWDKWEHGSPDYYNCGYYEQYFTGVPYAKPYSGTGVMGFVTLTNGQGSGTYTEGIAGALVSPIRAGHNYRLQFRLAIASQGVAGHPPFSTEIAFGFYFYNKKKRPEWNGSGIDVSWRENNFKAQINVLPTQLDALDEYKTFTFCLTPDDDYDSVYIGELFTADTRRLPGRSYYFNLDDMSLVEQPDTALQATLSQRQLCTGACLLLSSNDTERVSQIDLEAPGADFTPPATLPQRLCYGQPGTYPLWLTLHREGSCASYPFRDSITVTDPARPRLPDTTICPRAELPIDLRSFAGSRVTWNDGDTSLFRRFTGQGRYAVTIVTAGCSSTTSFQLNVRDLCTEDVMIPSAFSPNGDGLNDAFRVISNYPLRDFTLRVYDRWGKSRFYSTYYQLGWDGAGADLGTYYYRLSYRHPFTGELVAQKGDVTLVR